jgi:AcrR family transcriptional regulator
MATDTRGNDTKAALLEAAKQLISERGYAGASVRELAAAAGTNLGAVNYHFGSRENLLNQAILDLFQEWAGRVGDQGPADPDAEGLQQLAARARPLVDGIPDMQPLFVVGLEAILHSRRSPELHRQLAEHYARLRQKAIDGMLATKRGRELPPRFLEVVASYMVAVADGLQLQALLDPDMIPTGDELALMYETLAAAAMAVDAPAPSPENDSLP